MVHIVQFWKNALNVKGRARRKEYLFGVLSAYAVIMILLGILTPIAIKTEIMALVYIPSVLTLPMGVASITCGIRRLHDIGKKGILFLLSFVPCANFLLLYWILFVDSMPETNEWGESPKYGSGNGDVANVTPMTSLAGLGQNNSYDYNQNQFGGQDYNQQTNNFGYNQNQFGQQTQQDYNQQYNGYGYNQNQFGQQVQQDYSNQVTQDYSQQGQAPMQQTYNQQYNGYDQNQMAQQNQMYGQQYGYGYNQNQFGQQVQQDYSNQVTQDYSQQGQAPMQQTYNQQYNGYDQNQMAQQNQMYGQQYGYGYNQNQGQYNMNNNQYNGQ